MPFKKLQCSWSTLLVQIEGAKRFQNSPSRWFLRRSGGTSLRRRTTGAAARPSAPSSSSSPTLETSSASTRPWRCSHQRRKARGRLCASPGHKWGLCGLPRSLQEPLLLQRTTILVTYPFYILGSSGYCKQGWFQSMSVLYQREPTVIGAMQYVKGLD